MRLFQSTPGKQYFISIFIIGAALFATFSSVLYRQYSSLRNVNDWTQYNYEVLRQSRLVFTGIVNMETGIRGYFLTNQKNFLEPYNEARANFHSELEDFKKLTEPLPDSDKKIEAMMREFNLLDALFAKELDLYRVKGKAALTPALLSQQKQEMDRLRAMSDDFVDKRRTNLRGRIAQSKAEQDDFLYTLISGTGLAIGGMFVTTLIILTLIGRSRRAEDEARASEERFLTVMNGLNDGLFDFNMLGGTAYYSPAYKAMLGYSADEHPDRIETFKALIHPDDYDDAMEAIDRYSRHEIQSYSTTFRMRHRNGSFRWMLSRGVGIWAEGRIVRLIGTHTDITEQKKREEQLKQLNNDMETFTYITSHDLRVPLVNLKGFARELQHAINAVKPIIQRLIPSLGQDDAKIVNHALEEDMPESLSFIEKSVDKMDMLTTAVLDLSRIGKREYRFEPVDTAAIINRCLDSLNYEITQKKIEVTTGSLPTITSDKLAIEQVFGNILDNAIKYLDPTRPGKIYINAHDNGDEIIYSFQDNGRGIDKADHEKIFQIFRRARNTGDVRGVGMGMAFVQATVRKLGGVIWFESTVGVGTTFYLRIPKYITKGYNV